MYENRIVAFVDLLGFKQWVLDSQNATDIQRSIYSVMEIIHSYKTLNDRGIDGGLRKLGVQVTTFSDSAVISYPLDFDGGLFHVMLDLIHMQQEILNYGVWIRGGITIGKVFHDDYNIFGPAMIEAYILESKVANYPRVIIPQNVLYEGLKASPTHINGFDLNLMGSLIRKDLDGYYYLDYLCQGQEFDYPETDYSEWMGKVRNALISNLRKYNCDGIIQPNPHVFEKYQWVMQYWNHVVTPNYQIGLSDYS